MTVIPFPGTTLRWVGETTNISVYVFPHLCTIITFTNTSQQLFQTGSIFVLASLHLTCRIGIDNIAFMRATKCCSLLISLVCIFNCFSKTSLTSGEKWFLHNFGIPDVKMLLEKYLATAKTTEMWRSAYSDFVLESRKAIIYQS